MAKFARCGYGSRGQGLGKTEDGYTYVVNDNVRTGDVLQVVSTSRAGRKFGTTAKVRSKSLYSENTLKGQLAKQEVESKTGHEATRAYTGAELGLTRKGVSKQEYREQVRAGNVEKYIQKNPDSVLTQRTQETFDEYSKQFMNEGE